MDNFQNYKIKFVDFASNLNPVEFWVVVVTLAMFVIYLAYRLLGIGAVFALSLVYFFMYVLYTTGAFAFLLGIM